MRTLLLLPAFVLFLSACNGDEHASGETHEHHTDAAAPKATTAAHSEHGKALTLNNGQKWKLDDPTRKNVGEIKEIVHKAAARPTPDYHQVASDLQASTDKLIGECRMSGPDHDALHLWLEDYLPALKELHSTNRAMQKTAFHTIRTEVEQFDKYFE